MIDGWCPVSLSHRQVKAADRVGGCEIILPWPDGQPPIVVLNAGQQCDTTRREHAMAEQILGDAARAYGLVIVRSQVVMWPRPRQLVRPGRIEAHLLVLLIGRRWVHATGQPWPRRSWHTIPRIRQITFEGTTDGPAEGSTDEP
jgi:hypothetical protein